MRTEPRAKASAGSASPQPPVPSPRSSPPVPRPLFAALCVLFVASGAAGLIYEAIWSRYLGLFVGHGAYAQVIVLAIFLGGMSVGALLAGRRSERLANPLRWYAGIELAVGVVGFAFHDVYVAVTDLAHASIFPALGDGLPLTIVKWTIAALLILPQSVLLGATFPLMSAGAVRHLRQRAGQTIALLYFANSIGAAGGVLLAGFYLVAAVGLPGTILVAATINVVVAVLAYLVGGRGSTRDWGSGSEALRAAAATNLGLDGIAPAMLAVAFGTAVASFIYEIAWIRMLSLVLGSATHSFELMLSAFILGLALGSLWVRRRIDREAMPLGALALAQWCMGAAALATLPVYVASFAWLASLMQVFSHTSQGYAGFNLARYGLCLAVMLPSTFCAGMTLPLLTKILMSAGWGERAIGLVYGINTLGSIAGVVLASLVLLPLIGLKALLMLGAIVDMALGVAVFLRLGERARGRRLATGFAVATLAVVAFFGIATPLDRAVLTSGVFRGGWVPQTPGLFELLFYRDGRTATVSVARNSWRGDITLATNGKPDASLSPDWFAPARGKPQPLLVDNATQALVSLIALAHKPDARIGAVVGLGSGSSSHFLLAGPKIERAVTIEIEPAVVEGARLFYPANRRVYDDRRSEIVLDDAKSYFAAAPAPFDVIVSEPSNPWVSGVANLFTSEFYEAVARRLAPGGIFAQWLHLYEIDDDLVLNVLAALHQTFSDYEIFQLGPGDVVIVATKDGKLPKPDWSIFTQAAVREDLDRFVAFTPETLESLRVTNRAALKPLFDVGVLVNSDYFPFLDLGAEEARFAKAGANGFKQIEGQRFDLAAPFLGRRPLSPETAAAILGDQRLEARARSARLRAARDGGSAATPVDGETDAGDSDAMHRLSVWQRLLSTPAPPADWRHWVADTIVVERDVHGGAAGVADAKFYQQAHAYLDEQNAPPPARDAISFLEALATWDFATVSRTADRLLALHIQGEPWIPPDLLLEGAVIAKLHKGKPDAARSFYEVLAPKAYREPRDLRRRLLEAYVTRPDSVELKGTKG